MNLKQRIDVLKQSAELVQKAGHLTIDDAYNTKIALDNVYADCTDINAINTLINVAERGRSNGVFGFQDCHYIYLAIDGIENEIEHFRQSKDISPENAE